MIDLPQLREGQQIRVVQRVNEGKRERSVPFTGKLLKVRGFGVNQTITVRQNLEGVDVDKIFPTALPTLVKIEVVGQVKSLVKGESLKPKKSRKARKTTKPRKRK